MKQRAQMNTMFWFIYSDLLRCPSNTMQAHQPRAGTTPTGLDPPTSTSNQESASQANLTDFYSSTDVHSSQMTLVSLKLTKLFNVRVLFEDNTDIMESNF